MKNFRLNCRVSEEEWNKVLKKAEEENISVSEYIRNTLFREPIGGVTEQEVNELIRDLTYQIRKIGININQLAKAANGRYFRGRDKELLFREQEKLSFLLEQYVRKIEKKKDQILYQEGSAGPDD